MWRKLVRCKELDSGYINQTKGTQAALWLCDVISSLTMPLCPTSFPFKLEQRFSWQDSRFLFCHPIRGIEILKIFTHLFLSCNIYVYYLSQQQKKQNKNKNSLILSFFHPLHVYLHKSSKLKHINTCKQTITTCFLSQSLHTLCILYYFLRALYIQHLILYCYYFYLSILTKNWAFYFK